MVLILGAGPAGLAAGYTAQRAGAPVTLIEQNQHVGGLCTSIDHEGFVLDLGPHFFTHEAPPPVVALWREVLGDEYLSFPNVTRMYWRGRFFDYPPAPTRILRSLGPAESLRIAASYFEAQLRSGTHRNYAEQSVARFGAYFHQQCVAPYIEKLWGVPCEQISAEWQPGRVYGTSVVALLQRWLQPQPPSLVHYPKYGTRQLYQGIADKIRSAGGTIQLGAQVKKIRHEAGVVHTVEVGFGDQVHEYPAGQGLISSIPLPVLLRILEPAAPDSVVQASERLRLRSTVLVYLVLDGDQLFPDQCLYVMDPNLPVGRIANFANWSPFTRPNRNSAVCCEFWCNQGDATWGAPENELVRKAYQSLVTMGVAGGARVVSHHVLRAPKTHPLKELNHAATMAEISGYLSGLRNLQVVGRYGSFRYQDMHVSLLAGIEGAEAVLQPGQPSRWEHQPWIPIPTQRSPREA